MKDRKFSNGLIVGVMGTLLVVTIIFNIYVYKNRYLFEMFRQGTTTSESSKHIEKLEGKIFSKIKYLMNIIDKDTIYEPDDNEVIEGIYKGIFDSLGDEYAAYYTKEDYESFLETATGEYVGIGAYVAQNENGYTYIVAPIKGSPAEKAGLKAGDVIYKVDGKDVSDQTTDQIAAKLKGKANTKVKVTIIREGATDEMVFTITRKKIETVTVAHKVVDDNIGYIQVSSFENVTVEQFRKALKELGKQKVDGLIIDLRDNPGGNLDVVVEMVDMFLEKGKMIVYTKDKKEKVTSRYMAQDNDAVKLPLCVLINGNSASASEIFAANIKDHKLGKLVGTTTFGKGIVQTVKPLTDGSAVKYTTAKYFTPDGLDIHKKGVEPDVKIELDIEDYREHNIDSQLNVAIKQLKKD